MTEVGDFTTTGIFIIVTALIWIVYDAYAYVTKKEETLSAAIRRWAYYSPIIPFFIGLLIGHWYW